jgi:hypothetical protein
MGRPECAENLNFSVSPSYTIRSLLSKCMRTVARAADFWALCRGAAVLPPLPGAFASHNDHVFARLKFVRFSLFATISDCQFHGCLLLL